MKTLILLIIVAAIGFNGALALKESAISLNLANEHRITVASGF